VAIITCNEEERLPDCLSSVSFAQDVVVVDCGSADKTTDIAIRGGARVFMEPWRGFGAQKQFAVDQCQHQWVLLLDADERIPRETVVEIESLLRGAPEHSAYSLPRKNFVMGRWVRYSGWWPDRTLRLFRKDKCHMPARAVHESLVVEGSTGRLQNPIVHYSIRNLGQVIDKANLYSTLGAEELFKQGKQSSVSKAIARSSYAFVRNYILRRGFLDRTPGLIIAVLDSMNIFFKYMKLKELHDNGNKRS
jgi:glycosyltransferase involved in cell wall biosynthesis